VGHSNSFINAPDVLSTSWSKAVSSSLRQESRLARGADRTSIGVLRRVSSTQQIKQIHSKRWKKCIDRFRVHFAAIRSGKEKIRLSRKLAFPTSKCAARARKGISRGTQNSMFWVYKCICSSQITKCWLQIIRHASLRLQAVVVDALWPLVVVVWTCHVSLGLTLIDYKDDLCGDLRTEEG
jgi:hypothetical protein